MYFFCKFCKYKIWLLLFTFFEHFHHNEWRWRNTAQSTFSHYRGEKLFLSQSQDVNDKYDQYNMLFLDTWNHHLRWTQAVESRVDNIYQSMQWYISTVVFYHIISTFGRDHQYIVYISKYIIHWKSVHCVWEIGSPRGVLLQDMTASLLSSCCIFFSFVLTS